jgi:ABC-type branched-subunit amino acid transport system ATPase component
VVEPAGTLLAVRDLDVWYGRVQVLFGLGLEVGPVAMMAMSAPTVRARPLLRALSGLVAPARGDRPRRARSTA